MKSLDLNTTSLSANEILHAFPNTLPNMQVEKYKENDSRYCLANIRQKHEIAKELLPTLRDQKRNAMEVIGSINRCQEQIYEALNYLVDNNGLSEAYMEGYTIEQRGATKEQFKTSHQNSLINLLNEVLVEPSKIFDYKYYPGAITILSMLGKIESLPSESMEFLKKALESWGSEHHDIYTGKNRENYLLETISKQDKPFALTSFGLSHNFENRISEWNKERENKFSYIKITPKEIQD